MEHTGETSGFAGRVSVAYWFGLHPADVDNMVEQLRWECRRLSVPFPADPDALDVVTLVLKARTAGAPVTFRDVARCMMAPPAV